MLHVRRLPRAPFLVGRAEIVEVEYAFLTAELGALRTYGVRVAGERRDAVHGIAEGSVCNVDRITGPEVVDS